jgi:cilia- and flagella-associated protein 65
MSQVLSSGGSSVLKMSAIGKFPYISMDCTEVDHGGVLVGQSSQRLVRLNNRSLVAATYNIRQQKPTDDDVFTITPSKGQISPGCSQELQLRFTPETAGTFSYSIADISVVGGNTLQLQQRGSAMSAAVTLSERFLEFGDIQVGHTVRKVPLSSQAWHVTV